MPYRRQTHATPPAAPRVFAVDAGIMPLWDMSLKPSNNSDILERLGIGPKIRGSAIIDVDEKSGDVTHADGITNKRRMQSVAPIDPDAFVFRMWGTKARRYGTWMPRLTADMDENQSFNNCRSTMVTDNANDMSFGWLTDILSLVTPPSGGNLLGEGMAYDKAAFLETLYDKDYGQASMMRSALSLSLHRNKGFVDDGTFIAQLSHVLYLVAQGGTSGSAAAGNDGRARANAEAVLRGDSGIHFKGWGVGRWKMEGPVKAEKGPNSDENRLVAPMLQDLGDADDKTDTADDGNCDFQKIPKEANKQIIKWWVKVPRPGS